MSQNLIFAKHGFSISLNEDIAFSPDIKHILRTTHNEINHLSKLLIYRLDCSVTADNNNVHLIYQKRYNYPAKIKFSGEGNQLLINNNDTIDILVFDKSGIHEESTLSLSELYKISNSFKKDFIPQHVECVELRETYITLCIDHNWLLAFQMQKNLVFSLRYCMNLINDVKYLHYTMDKVHCLTGHGKIFSYNLFDGSIWRMFDIYSILPDNVHCDKFLMDNNNHQIALYNKEMIFIFDISLVNQQYYELADNTSLYKSSGQSDSGSVKSFMTNVSSTSAYSRSDSVHALKLSKSKNKMSTNKTPLSWISYLNNLSIYHNLENSESESCNSNPFICICDLPENSSIVNILFYSSNSVGIWFVSDEKRADNYYRVYDCNTGQIESSQILSSDTRVVSLNYSRIHLDVFVNTCNLSLPLVNTNEEALINKLLNCIGSDCVAWLLQLNKSLSQSMQPLSLLKDALRDSQTHLIKLSIDLQLQELKRDITKTSVNVVILKGTTEMIMDEMIASIKDENIKESFKKQILVEAISYANKILTLLDSTLKEDFPLFENLKIEILKRVVLLRSDLQKPQLLPKEEPIQVSQWPMWELLSEKEVLKDGIKELPLVHCFLIIKRHWTSKDVIGERFKKLVFSIAVEYLEKQILDEAKQILIQTGYDPEEELLLICKTTFNRSLRDYLINSLTDIGKDIIKAWTFVKLVDGILDSYSDQMKETGYSVALDAKFSISDILNYSAESKTQILTDLYFNTQDSTLLKFLEKNICWDYLLSYNKIEGLLMWIDCTLSDHKPENSSLWPIDLFSEWKISQDMVDRVLTSNISDFTKDSVFYELARYGIFNSVEKDDPKAIMQRLAVCKLAINYEEVLSKPTSVLSCEEFEEMTLKHAVEHDMVDIAITAPQDLVLKANVTHPNWFCLWKSFCEVSNNWTDEGVLKLITETSEYLAEGDISTYLREHPYVAVATDLIQKKEISRVHAHLSPIIAAIVDLESPPEGVTMYSLLSGTVPFYTDNLFLFQANQNRPDKASNIQMPDFTNEELSEKYGHKQSLKYIDRLKHGRPCQAVTDLYNKNKKLTLQIKRNACIAVHGYALYHIDDLIVSASSIAFIEMLGNDSQLLRTHIACAAIIQKNKNYNEENLKSLLYKVVINTKGAAEEFLREVENALYEQWKDESDTFQCLQQNQLPVLLASLHGLPPPYIALKYAATSNNWLLFILTAQIFKYPVDKVQEMVSEFSCQNIREHLYYALALTITEPYDLNSVLSGELSLDKIKVGPNNCKLERESDLFVNICQCKNDPEKMLKISREVGNPVLALLATYLKPKSMTDVFCTWLTTSIEKDKVPAILDEPWTPAKVLNILELAVQLGYIRTLERAFTIYFSENPLHIFSSFLVDAVEEKNFEDSILKVKSFKAACLNLPDKISGRVIGFMNNRSWIANAAVKMASVALAYCFKSSYMQNKFLNILVESQISHHLSVSTPDYAQFLRLSNCLAHTDIKLDYIQLCIEDNRSQLPQHLISLIEKKDFQTAFQFASTSGLPLDSVHIASWIEKAKKVERQDKQFWNECQTALLQALVEPQIAADFFKSQANSITNPQERFVFLKYTLEWMSKVPTKDKNLLEESQVQLELYLAAIEDDFDIQLLTEGISYIPLRYLTTDLENRSAQVKCLHSLNSEQHYKLESLVHKLLGVGDIMTVVSLQDIFKHRNQDYDLLVASMSLAEGIPIQQMPQMVKDILGNDLFYSTTMQKLPVSSPRCKKENLTIMNLEEQQQVLNALYALQAHQSCVTPMFRNIICGFKVASALGLDYKTVITHPEPLSLLHIDDDFEIACNVFTLAALTESEFTQYLAEQLTSVIHLGPVEANNYVLWGCELDSQFSRLLQGINSLMLGNLLLSSVPNLDTKQPNTLREGVELLILSHTCFTKACNMEGISKILTMCGDIVNLLHDCCQWALMVHLITGIGRYTEMKYIFQILKDSHQFEFLLGKGLDKYTGLKSSLLDFVRNDKTQYMLVAVHFRMYSELAIMFSDEAKCLLGELVKGPEGSLVRSEANKQCLQAAMNKYADATNHYMQANKQKKGVMCIQQAELVALQLLLFNSIPPPQIVYCLINLTPDQVTALVMSFLSYEQACIVAAAYNLVIDWGAALYHHCIVQGQTSYLNAWCQHNNFTLTIVQDVARRFQNSKLANSNMEINMKWFLSAVSQVDIRYRICSQLGFKDLLETILSGPDLAYLKDTIFQKGIKNQEL